MDGLRIILRKIIGREGGTGLSVLTCAGLACPILLCIQHHEYGDVLFRIHAHAIAVAARVSHGVLQPLEVPAPAERSFNIQSELTNNPAT